VASLSVSVMAHPKRAHLVEPLVDRLGLTGDDVAWDRRGERWDTGRRAWEMHDPRADWHMVIQEDSIVVRDLIPGLKKALDHVPKECNVCPFVGTRRPAQRTVQRLISLAERQRASWIEFPSLFWGLAIIAPTPVIPRMLAFGDSITAYPNYDKRIGQYFVQKLHWPTYCTWPNLIDHRDDEPSLCGHGPGRIAHRFAGEDASALDVNWGGPVATYSKLPAVEMRRYYRRGKRIPFSDFQS